MLSTGLRKDQHVWVQVVMQNVIWGIIIEFMNKTAASLVKLFLINLKFAKLNFAIFNTFFFLKKVENPVIILNI